MDLLKTLWRRWLVIAHVIGRFNTKVIMTVMYFTAIAPFALAVRWFTNPLHLHDYPSWTPLPARTDRTTGLDAARQMF